MRFYEFESREIVKRAGIPVTDYGFAKSADEAREIAERIGGPTVIKSQVLTGGRMKAGGVQFADTPDEAAAAVTGGPLTRVARVAARLARLFRERDMTLAEINPLAQLEDGTFVALDAHMEMENEAIPRQRSLLNELGIAEDEGTREGHEPSAFEAAVKAIDSADHRGVIQGKDTGFHGNLGLVIGAGGGSLTLTDAVRAHGGRPANYSEIGGNPSVAKACGLAKQVLLKDGVEKIAVMMSIVSNTRVDIVARGVIKACLELGRDPAETIAIFRIPGAWEEEGFKILDRYGIEYCDRSVSMWEAAGRAVAKIQGAPA